VKLAKTMSQTSTELVGQEKRGIGGITSWLVSGLKLEEQQ